MKHAPVNPKGSPIPVRFTETEESFLREAATQTGLPSSELIRRAIRLMKRQQELVRGFSFVLELAA